MAKAKKVKGKDLMVFVNDKAIALATNHTLKLTAETGDSSTKDSGDWGDEEITKMTWEATSENLCSADESANSYEQMLDLMLAREPVEVKVGIPTNATNDEVPEGTSAAVPLSPQMPYALTVYEFAKMEPLDPTADRCGRYPHAGSSHCSSV